MKKKYISVESLKKAIHYFESQTIKSPEQLGLFFFFKGIGINSLEDNYYKKVGEMSDEEKKNLYTVLFRLAAVFDVNEKPGKRACLFPFSISTDVKGRSFFNGGTNFKDLLSRIRDTIDNTLIDEGKYLKVSNDNKDKFSFVRNYIEILKGESFLEGNKISLTNFSIWYMRFREFQVELDASDENLSYVCVKKTCEELNITNEEIEELFIDDRSVISFTSTEIKGKDLRELINFTENPEVISEQRGFEMNTNNLIDNEYILNASQNSGENISSKDLLNLLRASKQVILHGAPGTGKSYATEQIQKEFDEVIKIQFHPSMAYEQFIGGYSVDKNGNITPKIGIFLETCLKAIKHTEKEYLFIIDEINRGNISKIFGETIISLDRGYDVQLSQELVDKENNVIERFYIPQNLFILGTMNSADRSIALVDYAIRRRFAFVRFEPNYEIIKATSVYSGNENIHMDSLLRKINDRIFRVLKDEDLLLGQSYFMPDWVRVNDKYKWTDKDIKTLFNHYIIPIIEEYTFSNNKQLKEILGSEISKRISDTDRFIKELIKEFQLS